MTAVETLATFSAGLRWDAVDAAVRAQVKEHLLDTLGVICAGVESPEGRAAQRVVERWGGTEQATVVGRTRRVPAPHAAFLNALHGRIHTFDDTYESGPVHPGSIAVSAALAAAEVSACSGSDLLAAILAGYEVATRVSAALGPSHYGSGFHNTGTCNAFGAGAAAARAFGATAEATADALGLAGEAAAGLRQYQIDGSMGDTALNGARAAQTGVAAVELQRAGLAGPHGILDGRWGLFRVMSSGADPSRITDGLGTSYEFTSVSLKPYPSCRFTHGPLEVLLDLRARHEIAPGDIERVEIVTFRESVEVSDKPAVESRLDAILSHQYNAARALVDGSVTLAAYEPARVAEPGVRSLAERVRVLFDETLQDAYPAKWPHWVAIALKNGRHFVGQSQHPPGGPEAPLGWKRVHEKFLALAVPVLGELASERIASIVAKLDEAAGIDDLTSLLRAA